MAATRVLDSTANTAGTPPKVTPVVVNSPVPVMSTSVPPAGRPVSGLKPVTVGAPTTRKDTDAVAVPPRAVTTSDTTPAAWAGLTTVSSLSDSTVGVTTVAPNATDVVVASPRPVTVMVAPPATGPDDGDTSTMTGGGCSRRAPGCWCPRAC